MRWRNQIFLTLLIALLAVLVPTAVALAQLPQFPNSFYGDVTVNGGRPGLVGTIVTAVVDNGVIGSEKRYTIAITESGKYGSPNGLKLKVGGDQQGDIGDGSNIQFYLSHFPLPSVIDDLEPVAEVSFFADGAPHNTQLDLVSTGPDQIIGLPNPGQFAIVSAPTLLSEVPIIEQVDPAGSSLIMVYVNNQFLILGEPGFDEEIVKPLTAFYVTASSNAVVGFKSAEITAPVETSRSLDSGWNLIGTNFPGTAQDELTQIQDIATDAGMVTLHVPNAANGKKASGQEDWESDGDRDLNASPITGLPDRNLSELDGYWVFLNGPRTYSKILTPTGESPSSEQN